ncbi:MAG: glycosyltransferase family 39 protein [Anaerolineae bacterium]|nr:glycosyltransferase family 39 protein [Anaerolineae bacterium]
MFKRHPQLWLAVALLLLAAGMRLWSLGTLPPGFSNPELDNLAVTAVIDSGLVRVFEQDGLHGRETLFHIAQAVFVRIAGKGQITLRLVSVWLGLLALAVVYALARRLYSSRAALLALGLMGVGMWPVVLSRLSIYEAALPLFSGAVLLALSHTFYIRQRISPEPPNLASYTILGVLVAISLYAHWFGLFLAAVVTGTVLYLFLTRQQISRRAAGTSLFAIGLSAIVMIPYLATSIQLPDLNALSSLRAALSPTSLPDSIIGGLAAIFPRGDLNVVYNMPGRPLLGPVSAVLFAVGLGLGFHHWRRPAMFIPSLAAVITLIPVLFSTRPGAFPMLAGALPLVFLIVARSADEALNLLARERPRWRQAVPWLAVGLVVINGVWTGADLFRGWPRLGEMRSAFHAEQGLLAYYLDRNVYTQPTVVCSPRLQDTQEMPGDPKFLSFLMHRADAGVRYVDCANGLILADGGAPQLLAFTDTTILDRMHPALRRWLEGATPVDIPGLVAGTVLRLDVATELENTVGSLITTAPTGWAPESPGGAGPVSLPVRFGGNITFLGYQPQEAITYAPGDVVPVVTYWRADGEVPRDLRIFTHVLSDPAAIVAQSSVINVWSPTLRSRDIFMQVSYIALPESVPTGQYDLSIGAYQATSGLRLPIFDGDRVRGDRLFLYQITVNAPEPGD